ncbi:CBS domain-containing protein [Streptomyces sp. V3I7]|uniref:CBS domain-containing protein n=1 Tax=Streptomyces sp. V3I7 TaxID=3042278 RepID=UPI0027883CEF|nr:CBS domain-containing protein [Streptomyces sp. V3I7]MDQ0994369.1 CBS domain-containing protein [Streptomyces sp. V3I7]
MTKNVRDIMTGAPTAVDAGESVASVARTMRDQNIGVVLVMDEDDALGLVSDRDLAGAVADGADPGLMTVAQLVRGDLLTVEADDDVTHAAGTMREHETRQVAVVENGELVGLLFLDDPAVQGQIGSITTSTPDPHGSPGPRP